MRHRDLTLAGGAGLLPDEAAAAPPPALAEGDTRLPDLRAREIAVVAPLIALLLVLGVYPKPALDVINPAVTHTLTTIDQPDPAPRMAEGPVR